MMNNKNKMSKDIFEKEKVKLTPETGFNLVGIDYFEVHRESIVFN
jgi:hypothetical protein